METPQISALALAKGAHAAALEDIVARATVYFAGEDPRPEAVEQFLAGLPVWTLRGIDYEVFEALPPPEQMNLERTYKPQPPVNAHPRRPVSRELTTAEQASVEGLSWAERLTKGRQMQESPLPRPDGA